jgi:lipopolysaccharide export LptBFGC system permease protein LptF
MNVTVRFSNPFYLSLFSAAVLLIGFSIGARWGRSATAGYAIFWAIVALLVHDVAMAFLAGFTAYKLAMHLKK